VEQAAREWRGLALPAALTRRLPRAMRPLAVLRGMALHGENGAPLGRFLRAPAAGPDRPLILPNRYRFLYGMPCLQRNFT
jgi:hypothetical protein